MAKKAPPRSDNLPPAKSSRELPRGSSSYKLSPFDITVLGVDTPPDDKNPLIDITERHAAASIERLARNIILTGQINDVVLVKNGDRYETDEGRRRVLAFRMIWQWVDAEDPRAKGLSLTPMVSCSLKSGSETQRALRMVSANEHAMADTPLTKADKANRLLALGIPDEDVMIAFGCSDQTLRNWKRAESFSEATRAAIKAGRIGFTAALADFAGKSYDEQAENLKTVLDMPEASADEIEKQLAADRAALVATQPTADEPPANDRKRRGKTGAAKPAKPSARTVRERLGGSVKPKGKQLRLLAEVLTADIDKKKADRYFQIDDAWQFALDLVDVARGKKAANRVKGLVAVFKGEVEIESEEDDDGDDEE